MNNKYVVFNKSNYFIYGIVKAANSMGAIKEIRNSRGLKSTLVEATLVNKT